MDEHTTRSEKKHAQNTHGLRRCEFPFRMTSTPPLPAAAITQCFTPKSIPTTDMALILLLTLRYSREYVRENGSR